MDANWSWLIAVLLAACASFISNLGVTLQKLHHVRTAHHHGPDLRDDYHKGWMWRVGLALIFFGSLADFAALSFGPQSLVAPLGSLTLVSNVIFAPLLLKETIGHWDVVATIFIIVGSSIAVAFGSHESQNYNVSQLFGHFERFDFILYACIMGAWSIVLYLSIQKIEKIEKEDGNHSPRYLQYRAFQRFAYPSLSGTVGAQSVLFAKCSVELLSNTFRHFKDGGVEPEDYSASGTTNNGTATGQPAGTTPEVYESQNMFIYWQSYLIVIAMVVTIFGQIKYLNDGLRRFDASYSVPVFTSFWIILSVVSGMIFYREWIGMDFLQCMMFGFGVLVTVTGVVILGGREQGHATAGHVKVSQQDEEDEENSRHGHGHSHNHTHEGINSEHKHINDSLTSEDSLIHHSRHHRASDDVEDSLSHSNDLHLDLDGSDGGDEAHDHHSTHSTHSHASARSTHSSTSSSTHSRSSSRESHHTHHHHHQQHIHHSSHNPNDEDHEATVEEGAKTLVIEASQRISKAFNSLRGKGDASFSSGLNSSSAPNNPFSRSTTSIHNESDDESDDDRISLMKSTQKKSKLFGTPSGAGGSARAHHSANNSSNWRHTV